MREITIDKSGRCPAVVSLVAPPHVGLAKVPTTPGDRGKGIRQGVARGLDIAGQPAAAQVDTAGNLFIRLDGS